MPGSRVQPQRKDIPDVTRSRGRQSTPRLRRGLLDNGYSELPISSEHAVAIESLPPIRKYPFDRMLVAQTHVVGITLLTSDSRVAQ